MPEPIYIVAARRTPIGAFQGVLKALTAPQLGAAAVRGALERSGIRGEQVDEVLLGCVLPAGVGQAPARQAAMIGCDAIRAGSARVVVAGGFESMTNAPYLLPKARAGLRLGHGELLDHMFYDGLQNPYDGALMGHFADATARTYGFSRAEQDAFAAESVRRALAACESGAFGAELVAVTVKSRKGEQVVDRDEAPYGCDIDKIPQLKPAFDKDGTVT